MKQIPVILFGVGGVGRTLLKQILESRESVAARNRLHFDFVGVSDSRSWSWDPAGLDDEWLQAVAARRRGARVGDEERPDHAAILQQATAAGLGNALVVDVTAAEGMEPFLQEALALGYGVVLANKKPLTGPWTGAQRFYGLSHLRYEATVGAGQPVMATLRYLLDTNDPILQMEGQLSGTLGYICRRLDAGDRFSVALAAARGRGYTEPDPREDLGGRDVMRKLLILARTAGWPLEEADISVESLFPSALAHLDAQEFMLASLALDAPLRDRVNAAGAAGEVLRHVAAVEESGGSVGLKPVPLESPTANLKYIAFRTGHYDDEPLLIAGKGAGVGITAAGVLGDMIALARESD